jgi:hypothetical protein
VLLPARLGKQRACLCKPRETARQSRSRALDAHNLRTPPANRMQFLRSRRCRTHGLRLIAPTSVKRRTDWRQPPCTDTRKRARTDPAKQPCTDTRATRRSPRATRAGPHRHPI